MSVDVQPGIIRPVAPLDLTRGFWRQLRHQRLRALSMALRSEQAESAGDGKSGKYRNGHGEIVS
ncbi:MAG: hypothetical protein KDD83_04200 [Caldilineaceae bacterium]|nr:hypothetical protein [Caldilineaceae bacterium]